MESFDDDFAQDAATDCTEDYDAYKNTFRKSDEKILQAMQERLTRRTVMYEINKLEPLREEYDAVMAKIQRAVDPFGLSANAYVSATKNELYRFFLATAKGKKPPRQRSRHGHRKHRLKQIVAPRYRHPNDPSLTWAGRGSRPKWVRDYLAGGEGRSLQDLFIRPVTRSSGAPHWP